MASTNPSYSQLARLLGIGLVALLSNHLISKALTADSKHHRNIEDQIHTQKQLMAFNRRKSVVREEKKKEEKWGSLNLIEENEDPLLDELKQMDSLLFSLERVNNLIVDLKLENPQTIPCPLINYGTKKRKEQPFLSPSTVVKPGSFIVAQSVYRPGMTLDLQKKFLRAGPRETQFFDPSKVRADIVCLGNVCPGMNTVTRQLVLTLKNTYNVEKVFGVQYSFKGYYENKIIELDQKMVEKSHHRGGCFLGLSKTQFNAIKIVDSLVERQVNHVYLVGANKTLKASYGIYEQIKKRRLPIAICVILKGINRDIPIFDTCFGFETAVEESCKILEHAYSTAKSHLNGISIVKLPGYNSGFLSCFAVQSVININVCLVPEFSFDIYGEFGLLNFICERVKHRGSCTIAYSEGIHNSARDFCPEEKKQNISDDFDNFLLGEIKKTLKKQKLTPHIAFFDGIQIVRSTPANSIDTKLCCQNANSSIQGLMCGYTNFACGHLADRNAMISVEELINSESTTKLREEDDSWQRLIAITGQPSFINRAENDSSE